MILVKLITIIVLAYLLGAIPWGLIVGRLAGNVDIRGYGSGKIGGTNVMRLLGRKAGVIVIALDVAKATAAVIAAGIIMGDTTVMLGSLPLYRPIVQLTAALMVIVGHNWSVFIKFSGGRGVASYFGTLLPIAPAVAIFGAQVLFATAVSTKYMSLGSIVGVVATWCLLVPLTLFHGISPLFLAYGLFASILIVYQHRDNIYRLQSGTERRLGDKAKELR